jgi:hypothetical protein
MKRLLSIAFLTLLLCGVDFGQCPTITVSGPRGVTNRGETMTFRTDVSAVGPRLAFEWTVSSGTIMSGQATSEITVKPDGDTTFVNITANVTVEGLPSGCEKTASDTAPLESAPVCGMPIDEWGNTVSLNDQRGRLDAVFAELSQNPKHTGFLMFYILAKDRLDSKNSRVQFVLRHAKFRKFDMSRIWFGLEVWDEVRTKVFSFEMHPNSTLPCDKCLIIKGGDL